MTVLLLSHARREHLAAVLYIFSQERKVRSDTARVWQKDFCDSYG